MANTHMTERVNTVVIGGGQAGLSVGYHLAKRGVHFVILDASARIGDVWRRRWDSLRLFTPARHAGLDGLPFPAPSFSFPTKNEMAEYLETYSRTFALPVRSGVRVDRLSRLGDKFLAVAGNKRFEAENVVVAMAHYQQPRVPPFAGQLDPRIVQLHSFEYRNPGQLQAGDVLIVGAGNSGAEIALETARNGHRTSLAGRETGHVPFRIDGLAARLVLSRLVLRVLFHRVLSMATPIGRKVRPRMLRVAAPLIRIKPRDLTRARAGIDDDREGLQRRVERVHFLASPRTDDHMSVRRRANGDGLTDVLGARGEDGADRADRDWRLRAGCRGRGCGEYENCNMAHQ
jgi:putative flavoprotein involved in K+ transport